MKTELSERLKKYRETAGLSEKELAHSLGTDIALVKSWESGQSLPAEETLDSLCALYGVNRDQLTYLDPDELIGAGSAPETTALPAAAENGKSHGITDVFRKRDRSFAFVMIPVFCAALAVFLGLGLSRGLWHPVWLVFLCVPVVYTFIKALVNGSLRKFDYIMFTVVLYLFTGFVLGNWHPSWVIFLTVPVFYIAA